MYLVRNKITVDHVLLDQPNNIIDPVDAQIKMFLEGFAYDFNDKYINNDPTSTATGNTPDCFPGLKYRLDNFNAYDIPGEMSITSTADISTANLFASASATTGAAAANRLISDMQYVLDNMNSPDGDGVVAYMSEQTKRQVEMAIRVMGIGAGFDITQDSYDRPVEKYKNVTIRVVGRKSDGVTPVISNTQTITGITASTASQIYFVRYGSGYVQGWQSGPFKPTYLGLSKENGIMHNVLFDWGAGLWIPHVRALGRLNLKVN
jgi:hypothetical protein